MTSIHHVLLLKRSFVQFSQFPANRAYPSRRNSRADLALWLVVTTVFTLALHLAQRSYTKPDLRVSAIPTPTSISNPSPPIHPISKELFNHLAALQARGNFMFAQVERKKVHATKSAMLPNLSRGHEGIILLFPFL